MYGNDDIKRLQRISESLLVTEGISILSEPTVEADGGSAEVVKAVPPRIRRMVPKTAEMIKAAKAKKQAEDEMLRKADAPDRWRKGDTYQKWLSKQYRNEEAPGSEGMDEWSPVAAFQRWRSKGKKPAASQEKKKAFTPAFKGHKAAMKSTDKRGITTEIDPLTYKKRRYLSIPGVTESRKRRYSRV